MKQVRSLVALGLGAFLFGCAGNSTNVTTAGGSLGGGTFTLVGDPQIEVVYVPGLTSTETLPTFGDALNIRTSERVQFQLVGTTTTGARVVLPTTWRSNDETNTFGNLAGNTGVFTAGTRQTAVNQLITARYGERDYTVEYAVKPRQTMLITSILDRRTGLPIPNVIVNFFDGANNLIGSAKSNFDGSIRAAVSRQVQKFQLVSDTIPAGYHRLIRFNSDDFPINAKPDYLNNRNASGAIIPVTVNNTGWTFRATGVGQLCKPNLTFFQSGDYMNGDTFLPTPIFVVPTGDTAEFTVPIDPIADAAPCAP